MQVPPFLGGQPPGELRRVECGLTGYGQDFASVDIQHYGCSGLAVEGIFSHLLQGCLEGQDQIVARLRILGLENAHGFALDIDLDSALSVDAA